MKVSRGIAVSLFAFGLASVASATDFYWIGGGGDNYITTAANWSLTGGGGLLALSRRATQSAARTCLSSTASRAP